MNIRGRIRDASVVRRAMPGGIDTCDCEFSIPEGEPIAGGSISESESFVDFNLGPFLTPPPDGPPFDNTACVLNYIEQFLFLSLPAGSDAELYVP